MNEGVGGKKIRSWFPHSLPPSIPTLSPSLTPSLPSPPSLPPSFPLPPCSPVLTSHVQSIVEEFAQLGRYHRLALAPLYLTPVASVGIFSSSKVTHRHRARGEGTGLRWQPSTKPPFYLNL